MEDLKKIFNETKFNPKVELVENESTDKLYLYGSIVEEVPKNWWTGEEVDGDYITMDSIKDAFNQSKNKNIEIHLNSRGGEVYTSVAIGNFIKDSDKNVTMVIDAIAASGASIIAMSGDKIKMYPNSMMMIHRASVRCYGNADDLRKVAENLEKFDETVQASYLNHFKGTSDELKALIWNETYLTADECLTLGFCEEIIDKPKEKKEVVENKEKTNVKASLLDKYKITKKEEPKVMNKEKKNILNKFKKGE